MDGTAFDTLIKQLSTSRVTRANALRGLVTGATALAGVRLTTDGAGAGKKGETKRKWCHRGDDFTILGKTKKLTKEQRKQHKRKHAADYKGTCTAARIVLPAGGAGRCDNFTDCDHRLCLNGRCLADVSCEGIVVGNEACDDLLGDDLTPMLCNEPGDVNGNPIAPDDVCILDRHSGIGYWCSPSPPSDCVTLEDDFPGFTLACVDFICVVDCRADQQAACNAFEEAYPSYGSFTCVSGACLREVA